MLSCRPTRALALAAITAIPSAALAQQCITLDGVISASEPWRLLTEAADTEPSIGGSAVNSDAIAESSAYNWWDGLNNVNVAMNDNRGDLQRIYWYADESYFYIAVAGPTAPFNSFADNGPLASNDKGDLYIALDTAPGFGFVVLSALQSTQVYGQRAVDFGAGPGFSPDRIFAVQFVDNGGGGGGRANLESVGGVYSVSPDMPQGDLPGMAWNARINSAAAYDTFNQNAGEFEIRIPWAQLGLPGRPPRQQNFRMAAFVTQNFAQSDAYDSAPGVGNGTLFEQIGDCPGDPDTFGQLGACDSGSFGASQPGANFVALLTAEVGNTDEVDTIGACFDFYLDTGCAGDANADGRVDAADLSVFLANFGQTAAGAAFGNFNCDTLVNSADLSILLANFGCTN